MFHKCVLDKIKMLNKNVYIGFTKEIDYKVEFKLTEMHFANPFEKIT